MKLTAKYLREILHYDPETGVFTWRVNRHQKIKAGDVAGTLSHGYIQIGIDYRGYRAHRLAWLYMTGHWPPSKTDHKNRNRADNRWGNLREATTGQNSMNQKVRAGRKCTGVDWRPDKQRWRARIHVEGATHSLGHYLRFEDAVRVRRAAEKEYFNEFAPEQLA